MQGSSMFSMLKLALFFLEEFISGRIVFAGFLRCVKSVQNLIFKYDFQKDVPEFQIGQIFFRFTNENEKYLKMKNAVRVCLHRLGKNPLNMYLL